jgi:hypothetical protein
VEGDPRAQCSLAATPRGEAHCRHNST